MSLLMMAGAASAATTSFSGVLVDAFEEGSGAAPVFTGAAVDDRFFGSFEYGDNAGQADFIYTEPNEVEWEFLGFPWSAFVGNGSASVSGTEVFVNIQDNFALDAEEAALATELLGFAVAEGTLADSWSVSAYSNGAYEEDPNPLDSDDSEILSNGSLFDLVYFSLDTSMIPGLTYQPNPPALNAVDIAIFTIMEADAAGNELFSAIGIVDSTIIPLPPAIWLFGSSLALLGWVRRNIQRDTQGL